MTFGVGIVGAGYIGDRFGTKMHEHPQLEVKRVLDINFSTAVKLASKFRAIPTTKLDEVLDDKEIELLYIGTPPKYHAEYTIQGLENGKHVICEKPICIDSTKVTQMIEARDNSGKLTAINLPFRFNPGIRKIKEMLDQGELGEIERIELVFRFPRWPRDWQNVEWLKYQEQGGPLREVGTHYLFGLTELFGRISDVRVNTQYPSSGLCEVSSHGQIVIENRLICELDMINYGEGEETNTLTIYGSEKKVHHRRWGQLFSEENGQETEIKLPRIDSEEELIDQFVKVLKGESSIDKLVNFEIAGHVQEILKKIH